jgi:hypothetical protein
MTTGLRLAIFNRSTLVPDNAVAHWSPSLAAQLREFADAYGLVHPTLHRIASKTANLGLYDLVLYLDDNSDQAGDLGYHDPDRSGRVFAKDCTDNNVAVSSCVSHELLEALRDLFCEEWADAGSQEFAFEVCDPVESTTYTDGRLVVLSDYVLPMWFAAGQPGPYNRAGTLAEPFELDRLGYAIVRKDGAVKQVYGDEKAYAEHSAWRHATKQARVSRTARRLRAESA